MSNNEKTKNKSKKTIKNNGKCTIWYARDKKGRSLGIFPNSVNLLDEDICKNLSERYPFIEIVEDTILKAKVKIDEKETKTKGRPLGSKNNDEKHSNEKNSKE